MTEIEKRKCACRDCACMVDPAKAIEKDGQPYCSKSCADGHPNGASCGNPGCGCGG